MKMTCWIKGHFYSPPGRTTGATNFWGDYGIPAVCVWCGHRSKDITDLTAWMQAAKIVRDSVGEPITPEETKP